VLVDIVVLSHDLELFDATRDAVGERNPVWRARTAGESVDLLLTGRCGVLLLDLATVSMQPASFIRQIVDQFPDVVVVVAGIREDEPRLGPLLSDGLVFRFMHKPLSPKRAGMFLGAAIRSHAERRDGRAGLRLLPQVGRLRRRLGPRTRALLGGGLLLTAALLGSLLTVGPDGAGGESPGPTATQSRPSARSTAPQAGPAPQAERARQPEPTLQPEPALRSHEMPRTDPARLPDRAAGRPVRSRPTTSPSPVTSVPVAVAPAVERPAAGVAGVTQPAPRATTGIVRPDPLAPRITRRATPPRAVARGASRSYGAPIASGHAIAGIATPGNAMAPAGTDDPQADSTAVPAGVESRDLVALVTPAPEYPVQALRSGLEGWVEVEFTVDERGATGDVLVAGAEPAGVFDAAATAAVAGWRYLPRVVNGRAVPQRTSATLRFSVER
jgi:protein TonB